MKNRKNIFIYVAIIAFLTTLIAIFYGQNDMLTMILFGTVIVVTSIFTYGNRSSK